MALLLTGGGYAVVDIPDVTLAGDGHTFATRVRFHSYAAITRLFHLVADPSTYNYSGLSVDAGGSAQNMRTKDGGGTTITATDTTALALEVWHTITGRYDRVNDQLYIRVNGGTEVQVAASFNQNTFTHLMLGGVIMNNSGGVDATGDCDVAAVRFWDRFLTSAEDAAYHAATSFAEIDAIDVTDLAAAYDCVGDANSEIGGAALTLTGATVNADSPFGAALTISGVSAPNGFTPGESATATITGGLGATQGTGSVTYGGVVQSVTAWSDTSVTFTIVQGTNDYADHTLVVTGDDGRSAPSVQTLVPPAGNFTVRAASPVTDDPASIFYDTTPNVATGDQAEVNPMALTGLAINAQGLVTNVDAEGDFQFRLWDATDGSWSLWYTVTAALPDTQGPSVVSVGVPADGTYVANDVLSFTVTLDEATVVTGAPQLSLDLNGSERRADYVSGSGTVALLFEYTVQAGDYAPSGIGVGLIQSNGGTFKDAAGNDANVTLAGVPDTSLILAGAAPTGAPVFEVVDAQPTTATVTLSYSGTDLTGFEYSIDVGVTWTAVAGTFTISGLTPEQEYELRARAVNEFGSGSTSIVYFTTDPTSDTTPNLFSFTDVTGVARSIVTESDAIVVQGIDAGVSIPVTVTGGEYAVSTDGGATWTGWTSATTNVQLNYRIKVRHTTSDVYEGSTSTVLSVGTISDTFTSITLADTVAPVISLVGGNLDHIQGEPWVDPGYNVTDNAGVGGVTVSITGTIDVNTLGPQTLTYTATDEAGNASSTTRIVTIVEAAPGDMTAPVIQLVGGNVTLSVGDVWVDPGYSAYDDVDGEVVVSVSGTVNTAQAGVYTLTYTAKDAADNVTSVTRTVTVTADLSLQVLAPSYRTIVPEPTMAGGEASEQYHKAPQEVLDFDIELTDWLLGEADTISEGLAALTVISSDSALAVATSGYLAAEDRIKIWLEGGLDGVAYTVSAFITTDTGRRKKFIFRVLSRAYW